MVKKGKMEIAPHLQARGCQFETDKISFTTFKNKSKFEVNISKQKLSSKIETEIL